MKTTVIYNRTSTEEQNPENQLKACQNVAKKFNLDDYQVLSEQLSAWKTEIDRPEFNKVLEGIKNNEIKNLIVWDLDRIYRNRIKLTKFFELCKAYKCNIYSFRQDWLDTLNTVPEPWNEIMKGLLVQIMGWLAEEESNKRSERVKASLRRDNKGRTVSTSGKPWGRQQILYKVKKAIVEARKQGKSYKEITHEVYYWDKNNNKKFVSAGLVHKALSDFDKENGLKKYTQQRSE